MQGLRDRALPARAFQPILGQPVCPPTRLLSPHDSFIRSVSGCNPRQCSNAGFLSSNPRTPDSRPLKYLGAIMDKTDPRLPPYRAPPGRGVVLTNRFAAVNANHPRAALRAKVAGQVVLETTLGAGREASGLSCRSGPSNLFLAEQALQRSNTRWTARERFVTLMGATNSGHGPNSLSPRGSTS